MYEVTYMFHCDKRGRLALLKAAVKGVVSLRSGSTLHGVTVDEKDGVLRNVAVMHAGDAKGHGFELDMTSLRQACDLINAEDGGVKVHFKHPEIKEDGQVEDQVGAIVGRLRDCRVEGDVLRGDVYLGSYAKNLPALGDVWTYLLGVAKDDPTALGLSAVFSWMPDEKAKGVVARLTKMYQVDFVGDPAANPNGLLAEGDGDASAKKHPMGELIDACRGGISELRAYLDASAASDSMESIAAAAGKLSPMARAITMNARGVIDMCDGMTGGMVDDATSQAASMLIRTGNLFAQTAYASMDALDRSRWGTNDLAKACNMSYTSLRTAISTLSQCMDSSRPYTAATMAYTRRRNAASDKAMLKISK